MTVMDVCLTSSSKSIETTDFLEYIAKWYDKFFMFMSPNHW